MGFSFYSFSAFLLLNLFVILSSFLIVARFFDFKITGWAKLFLSVFVLFFFQVIISQIILGIFGVLNFYSVFALNAGVFVIASFLFAKKTIKKIKFPPSPKLNFLVILAVFSPFIAILLLRYFSALFQVPLEYDNTAYHLPFVVEWFRTGKLLPVYYSAFAGPIGYYPSNFELLDLWSVLPFGRDFFINLLNFPIFPLLILAIYSVAKNLKIPNAAALIAAGLFMYMPQTFRQMGIPLVDLFFIFTFVTAIYFIQEFVRTKSFFDLTLFSISTGLFLGTKYLGIPYFLPLLAIALVALFVFFRRNLKKLTLSFLIVALTVFVSGGFWYIRNWIDAGNPLFPMNVSVLGHTIFTGYYGLTDRLLSYSLLNNVVDIGHLKEFLVGFYRMIGGHILLIPVSILLLVIYFISLFFRKQKNHFDLIVGLLFLFCSAFYFYFYWQSPYTYVNLIPNVRYAMPFLIITCLMSGYVFSRIKILRYPFYFFAFLIFFYNIAFLVINTSSSIVMNDKLVLDLQLIPKYFILFSVYLFIFILLSLLIFRIRQRLLVGLCILLSIFSSFYLIKETLPQRELLKDNYYKIWYEADKNNFTYDLVSAVEWLDKHDPLAKIAYTGLNFHYHLFGRDWQREVDYININDCSNCRYFDYRDSPLSIRRDPDFDVWFKNLKSKNKEYLVVAPFITDGVKSWEFEWVNQHPENFVKVFESTNVYVYKILVSVL